MKKFVEALKTLGEINRLRILKLLQERPAYVCEIASVLGLSMATVSSHLSRMKQFGLVTDKREGIRIKYCLSEPEDPEVKKLVNFLKSTGENWKIVKEDRKKLEKISVDEVCRKLRLNAQSKP
jgi:ArsR family transcriptional regulator